MKILHTSDWHLGKSVMGRSMLEDQEYFIDNVFLPALDSEHPDAVIISGDIFDRSVAPVEALALFNRAVNETCSRGIVTAVIAGNHDGAQRLAVYSGLLRSQGLYISASPFDTPPIHIKDNSGELYIHLLPYFDAATARDILGRDDIHGQNAAFKAVMEKMRPYPAARNVLAAHCFAAGAVTCQSESQLSVGGSDGVDPAAFADFDYVALGHLHGPQRSGKNGYYSGSPLKYSFDEEHHKKSLSIVTFDEGGTQIRRLPCTPLRDMRTVTGNIKDIITAAKDDPAREDYIYANLTDTRPVFEPMALLREHYPNVLGLHPGWLDVGAAAANSKLDLKDGLRTGAADRVLFEEFLRQVCGKEPEPEEMKIFDELMEKAGETA